MREGVGEMRGAVLIIRQCMLLVFESAAVRCSMLDAPVVRRPGDCSDEAQAVKLQRLG
jgi:hypothetical protein